MVGQGVVGYRAWVKGGGVVGSRCGKGLRVVMVNGVVGVKGVVEVYGWQGYGVGV